MKVFLRPASNEAGLAFSGVAILGAMLVFAPLIMGGNRPLPLLILELAAIALLFLLLLRPSFEQHLSRPLLIALGLLVALPLVQLLPLPEFVWNWLPGRDFYAAASSAAGVTPKYRTVSLIPNATESALLALLVPLAVFLATVSTSEAQLKQLINLFIGLAVIQAIIGLAQFGTGSMTVLASLEGEGVSAAHGTYPNSDHLAGLLEMALPVALGLLIANIQIGGGTQARSNRKTPLRQRLSRLFSSGIRFNRVAIYAAAGFAILLGLTFSHSRTGVSLAMLGILVSSLIFGRWVGGQRSSRLITAFTVIGVALALEIGLSSVLSRFTGKGMTDDLRWSIFAGTIQGIREFFPIGSGFGTYPAVFRRFQPGNIPGIRQSCPQRLSRMALRRRPAGRHPDDRFPGALPPALAQDLAPRGILPALRLHADFRRNRSADDGAARAGRLQPAHPGQCRFLRLPGGGVLPPGNPGQGRTAAPIAKAFGKNLATTPAPAPKPVTLPEPPAPAADIRNPFAD